MGIHLLQQSAHLGMLCEMWMPKSSILMPKASILVTVTVELMQLEEYKQFARNIYTHCCLRQIIIDEVHLVLMHSAF